MPDDGQERVRRTAAEEPEVAGRDLPAVDVVVADHAQERLLGRAQPGVRHPVAEHAADDRQQVQVAVVDRVPLAGPSGTA